MVRSATGSETAGAVAESVGFAAPVSLAADMYAYSTTLVSSELDVPIGLLRPTDLMADLLQPLHARIPFRWVGEWTRAADGKSDRVVTLKAPSEGRLSLTSRAPPPANQSPLSPGCVAACTSCSRRIDTRV
jgi:hypothetical protein